jgi:iron complex transport system permease protein
MLSLKQLLKLIGFQLGVLLLVVLLALMIGPVIIPFKKIVAVFLQGSVNAEYSIVMGIRIPRIILAIAAGGGLSLAGVILQGMFHNPLVEPYTLGISGGASLGVALAVVFKINVAGDLFSLPAAGFAGALGIMAAIYLLSMKHGFISMNKLLLTGVMVSFIASSLIMLLLAMAQSEDLQGIIFWIMGSLDEANLTLIIVLLLVTLAALVVSFFFSLHLNAFMLGEDQAKNLGIEIERTKKILFILASLVTGFCVSVTGVIGFVGLVVPHLMRLLVGTDYRVLIVSSFFSGAIFLLLCDMAARTIIAPLELPIGVLTSIIGGVLLIFILLRKRSRP